MECVLFNDSNDPKKWCHVDHKTQVVGIDFYNLEWRDKIENSLVLKELHVFWKMNYKHQATVQYHKNLCHLKHACVDIFRIYIFYHLKDL